MSEVVDDNPLSAGADKTLMPVRMHPAHNDPSAEMTTKDRTIDFHPNEQKDGLLSLDTETSYKERWIPQRFLRPLHIHGS